MVAAARGRLASGGLPEERLRRFPPDQVLLLDEKREYEVRRDDVMKLMTLALLGGRGPGSPGRRGRSGRPHSSPKPWCLR